MNITDLLLRVQFCKGRRTPRFRLLLGLVFFTGYRSATYHFVLCPNMIVLSTGRWKNRRLARLRPHLYEQENI